MGAHNLLSLDAVSHFICNTVVTVPKILADCAFFSNDLLLWRLYKKLASTCFAYRIDVAVMRVLGALSPSCGPVGVAQALPLTQLGLEIQIEF